MTLTLDAYEYLLIRMRLERKGNLKLEPTPCDRGGTLQRTRNHRQTYDEIVFEEIYLANIPRHGQRVLFISNIVSVWLSLNTNRPQ